jgi:hypothetical protein
MLKYLNLSLVTGGLCALAMGMHMIYPPLAFIVVGAILFWIGLPD